MAKLQPVLSEDFDASELRPDQAKTTYAQVDVLIAGLSEVKSQLRQVIESDMDSANKTQYININGLQVATITYRAGGEGKPKCVDQQTYAQWLIAHGKADMTTTITVPVDAVMEPSYISELYKQPAFDANTGEETKPERTWPDGCEQGRGTAGGISVSYEKNIYTDLLNTLQPSTMMGLLTLGHVEEEPEAGEPEW